MKRMFAASGNEVLYLKRMAVGGVKLDGSLAPGAYRELTKEEVSCLMARAGMPEGENKSDANE